MKNNSVNNKQKTIEVMSNLLDIGKKLPIFSIDFYIEAKNNDIEDYLSKHVIKTTWDDKPLSETEIKNNIKFKLKEFHKSKDYNPIGISKLKMRKTMTLSGITFNNIYNLVSGMEKDMPKNYSYIGNITLSNLKN